MIDAQNNKKQSTDGIREQVNNRHWQLFELRLKSSQVNDEEENYTKSNDYRIIDRLKNIHQTEKPIEPHRRWEKFSSTLTSNSNENQRLVTLFRHVWTTNWNMKSNVESKKTDDDPSLHSHLKLSENDQKLVASILHRSD